jgi:N-methylhydantoinase A
VVKNNMDFSASICDAAGQMVAQGLAVPAHLGATMPALKGCMDYFGDAHFASYGYRSEGEPIQFVSLKVLGQGLSAVSRVPARVERDRESASAAGSRRAYFGPECGWLETPVLSRAALRAAPLPGPLIVEEYDTTTVVRPGWTARRDVWNNILLEKGDAK